MSHKKLLLLSLVGVLALSFVTGCGGDKKDAAATSKSIRFVVGAEPETLDPRKSTGMPEAKIEANLFEGLTTHGKDGKIVAGAAEKWTVSADGKVYTFNLRANAKWSNGEPVTAQDFEYAWKKVLEPSFASKYSQQLYFIAGAEAYNTGKGPADQVGVKAIDDKTLQVTLANPCPFFPSVLVHHAYYPINKKLDESNPKWAGDAKTLVGNGPYMMKSWTHQSKIETVKNPNYWDAANVKTEQVDYLLTDNNATALSMYDGNQADLVQDTLPPADQKRLLKEGKLKTAPYVANGYYAFYNPKAPFDNPKVRKAFAMAIDREAIVNSLGNGYTAAYGFVPPGIPDADGTTDFRKVGGNLFKTDVAEAKKLLAEAGFPDGKGIPPVVLIYNTHEVHKAIAEAIQEMWRKNLGVEVQLQNQEWKVFLQNRKTGNFVVARHGWVGDYEDPLTFMSLLDSTNGNNDAKYKNPEFDKLLAKTYEIQDPKERMKAFHDLEKMAISDDMGVAPIYFQPQPVLAKPNLKGLMTTSIGITYFKYAYME